MCVMSVLLIDISYHVSFSTAILDMVGTFLVSYFPYKIWYYYLNKDKVIRLDSSINLLKVILMIFSSSVLFSYCWLLTYNLYKVSSLQDLVLIKYYH